MSNRGSEHVSSYANLPAPSPEQGLNRYLQEIRRFPMLEPEQEYMLAKRWVDHEDTEADKPPPEKSSDHRSRIAEVVPSPASA